jgi:hypothetical protein
MLGRRSCKGSSKVWLDGSVPLDNSHPLEFEAQVCWRWYVVKGILHD